MTTVSPKSLECLKAFSRMNVECSFMVSKIYIPRITATIVASMEALEIRRMHPRSAAKHFSGDDRKSSRSGMALMTKQNEVSYLEDLHLREPAEQEIPK